MVKGRWKSGGIVPWFKKFCSRFREAPQLRDRGSAPVRQVHKMRYKSNFRCSRYPERDSQSHCLNFLKLRNAVQFIYIVVQYLTYTLSLAYHMIYNPVQNPRFSGSPFRLQPRCKENILQSRHRAKSGETRIQSTNELINKEIRTSTSSPVIDPHCKNILIFVLAFTLAGARARTFARGLVVEFHVLKRRRQEDFFEGVGPGADAEDALEDGEVG